MLSSLLVVVRFVLAVMGSLFGDTLLGSVPTLLVDPSGHFAVHFRLKP